MAKGDRLPRLLKLINTIQNHPGLTAVELARECEIGPRQIFRDLLTLQYGGVTISNEGEGYRLTGKFLLDQISFSLDEALTLLYGLKLIERQKGLFPVKMVKEHLLSLLPENLRNSIENLDPAVDMPGTAVDYSGKAELFRVLHHGIWESRQVELDYYCFGRDEQNIRKVDPYHLVFKDGFWYLLGFCHLREDRRLFRLDRIRHIRILDSKFKAEQLKPLTEQVETVWGIELGEEFEFKVRFWDDSARFVRETRFHPSQQIEEEADGTIIFASKASGLRPVVRWILSFGGEAQVLEPPELRKMVAEALRVGLEKY
jgi:predicted DNA-binding transcriptional regulator YafY